MAGADRGYRTRPNALPRPAPGHGGGLGCSPVSKKAMKPKFYVTTPIYYVNGAPHIGHAYTSIAADVLARFKRLDGYDVFFLTGTDEHGQKVEKAAAEAGLDPQAFADRVSADFRDMADADGHLLRRLHPHHRGAPQPLLRRAVAADAAAGDIYLGHYEGWYAVRDEAFYDEDELTTRRTAQASRRAARRWSGCASLAISSACRLAGPAAGLLRGESGVHRARLTPQRGDQLRARRAARSVGQPHQLQLGHPGARRPGARDVCLARRADQLRHRRRLSRRARAALALLARRPARGGQGHHALPRRLLAGLPDGRRAARRRGASPRTAGGRWRARR